MIASQVKERVINEMLDKTKEYQLDTLEHVKNPVVLEFLGLSQSESLIEDQLEFCYYIEFTKSFDGIRKGLCFYW